MRDNVSAVRSRLPHLANLPREKIELALLHYESNVDETVEAFQRGKSFLIPNFSLLPILTFQMEQSKR